MCKEAAKEGKMAHQRGPVLSEVKKIFRHHSQNEVGRKTLSASI